MKYERLVLNIPEVNMSNKNNPVTMQDISDLFGGVQSEINNWANQALGNLDHFNVRRLYTNYCDIQSADGETEIDGPVLKMYDKQPVLRIKLGYDPETSDFTFDMYDSAGNQNMYLNSSGEVVYAGNIYTAKDAYVGDNIVLGKLDSLIKSILFYNTTDGASAIIWDSTGNLIVGNDIGDIELQCFGSVNLDGSGINITGGLMSIASAGTSDDIMQITKSGAAHMYLYRSGSGNMYIQHDGSGILKIQSAGNMSIESTGGWVFGAGPWKIDRLFKNGTTTANEILNRAEIESLIPSISGASTTFESADGKTVTVSNGIITSVA